MRSLLVVAKRPAAGQTKTRLCPPLTAEAAAALYECFLRDTLDIMRAVPGATCGIGYLPEAAVNRTFNAYLFALISGMHS